MAVNSASASLTDALGQLIRVSTGKQKRYVQQRTVMAGVVGFLVSADLEVAKWSVYTSAGGRNKFLDEKTNRQLIKENVPADQQQLALEAYSNLNKVPLSEIRAELVKATKHSQLSADLKKLALERSQVETSCNESIDMLTQEIMDSNVKRDYLASKMLRDELTVRMSEKNSRLEKLNQQIQACEQLKQVLEQPQYLGSSNAHLLRRSGLEQVACDVKDQHQGDRGAQKIIFDIRNVSDDEYQFKYADFTSCHDYKNTSQSGGAYEGLYQVFERELDRNDNMSQQVSQVLLNTKLANW